jgi:hypothetical protein
MNFGKARKRLDVGWKADKLGAEERNGLRQQSRKERGRRAKEPEA